MHKLKDKISLSLPTPPIPLIKVPYYTPETIEYHTLIILGSKITVTTEYLTILFSAWLISF